jgi:serine/threonine protein kinase
LLEPEYCLYVCREILYSIEFVHSHGYSNGNLNPTGLMFKENNIIYLVNFDFCNRFERENTHIEYKDSQTEKVDANITYASRDRHAGIGKYH